MIGINLKFRTKLYFSFALIIGLAIICFNVFMRVRIYRQIEEGIIYNDLQLCIKVSENVDDYVGKMDDITKKLISDPNLLRIMRGPDAGLANQTEFEKLEQNRQIASIVSNAVSLTAFSHYNVYLYDRNENCIYQYNRNESNFHDMMAHPDNMEKLDSKKLVIFPNMSGESRKNHSLSYVRTFFDISGNKHGYIEVQSNVSKINEICDINKIGKVILADGNGDFAYVAEEIEDRTLDNVKSHVFKSQVFNEKNGFFYDESGNIYFYAASEYSGFITYIVYPEAVYYSSVNLLQQTTIVFFICITLAAIIMVIIFSGMLVKPLQDLRNSVLRVTYKDMGLSFSDTNNNEIEDLKDAFQSILNDLKQAAEREIASNKAEAQARLSALQAQIAPHFIHNVLYSISISSKEGRSDDVVLMCKQLSDMLRYTVNSKTHMVALAEEIQCIINYLGLQQKYYEDFLQYEINLQSEAAGLLVPRLSILPFIENAILHGFKDKKPPYRITVTGGIENNRWFIRVSDNGNGFGETKRKEIERKLYETQSLAGVEAKLEHEPGMGGLGLINSYLRFRILFGKEFRFTITDHIEEDGATIYMSGPICNDSQDSQ